MRSGAETSGPWAKFLGINLFALAAIPTVANLKVAWTFSMASDRGEEAAPLVVNFPLAIIAATISDFFIRPCH